MPFDVSLLLIALVAGCLAALVSNLLVPPLCGLSREFRGLARAEDHSSHRGAIPRLGGIAIFQGLVVALVGIGATQAPRWGEGAPSGSELVAFGTAVGLIFLLGLIDDLYGLTALKKLTIQTGAALLVVGAGWSFQVMTVPGFGRVELGTWGCALSVLWIVGVTNAVNLIDGLDGLAGGVVTIAGGSLLLYALLRGDLFSVLVLGCLVGACIGFLRHNWAPARIFMGDSGSLTLGFVLATVSVHSSMKAPAAVTILVPVLALGLPVVDTLLVMAVRFFEQPQDRWTSRLLRMFRADRQHLHHLLLHLAPHRHQIVPGLYVVALVFCAMALVVALTNSALLGLVLLLVEIGMVASMRTLGMNAMARRLARSQVEEMSHELHLPPTVEPEVSPRSSELRLPVST